MKRFPLTLAFWLIASVMSLLTGCFGGSTSDIPNSIELSVLHTDGSPAANTKYYVHSSTYLSESNTKPSPSGYTDKNGHAIVSIDRTETLFIEFIEDGQSSLLQCTPNSCKKDSVLNLLPWSSLSSIVVDANGLPQKNMKVRIFGLDRFQLTDSLGHYHFDDLPAGNLSLLVGEQAKGLQTNTVIEAEEIYTLPAQIYPLSDEIEIDTLTLNIQNQDIITDTLIGYPIAIRIDKLKRSSSDSIDLQKIDFISQRGARLPFQESRPGMLRIASDILYPGIQNKIHVLRYTTPTTPNSAPIFASQNGFVGVWHFQSPVLGFFANQVSDNFPCTFAGVWSDTTYQQSPFGEALTFPGGTARLDCGNLDLDTLVTVEGWVKIDQFSENARLIAKVDTLDSTLSYHSYTINTGTDSGSIHFGIHMTSGDGNLVTPSAFELGSWVYLAMTFDGSIMHTYVNGNLTEIRKNLIPPIIDSDAPLSMGGATRYETRTLVGAMDEVSISKLPRSPSWFALTYLLRTSNIMELHSSN